MLTRIILFGIFGGLCGLGALIVMALIAKSSGKFFDILNFEYNDSLWGKVDDWAIRYGYKVKEDHGTSRLYQKGAGFWTAPVMVEVSQNGNQCYVKAYIIINGLIVKSDMALTPPGFMCKIPRAKGKTEVNELMKELGQYTFQ
ncbi:MAG: hypothetical protein FWD70_06050 [Desulfuromonadales bacterium]|nr:hypothetical protein [Desulfuromonadales bacterium]